MRRGILMAALLLAIFILSMLSFTGFHPEEGFSQTENAGYLPAFLTFAACALILPNRWFALVAILLLSADYLLVCLSMGYPSPGVSLAFMLALSGFFLRRSQAG